MFMLRELELLRRLTPKQMPMLVLFILVDLRISWFCSGQRLALYYVRHPWGPDVVSFWKLFWDLYIIYIGINLRLGVILGCQAGIGLGPG